MYLFTCTICTREVVDYPGRNGRDKHLPPLCRYCESYYSDRKPAGGNFMDRRIACQISALSNALSGEAHNRRWGALHVKS